MRMLRSILSCLAASSLAALPALGADACTAPLATIEADGSVWGGSKDALRAAFAAGLPLRVGWSLDVDGDGRPEISHWADAGFLTEFEGEVFAQLHDIQKQAPRRGTAAISMPAGRQRWSGLLGSTGVLESHFDDGEVAAPSVRVRSRWCVDPSASACEVPRWRLVYHHDADGEPLAGSKEDLFDAVRRGQPLRLAWGVKARVDGRDVPVEHAAEPDFVSVVGGAELFAQLPEHVAQSTYHDVEGARFEKGAVLWRGLLGTTGAFDAVKVDRATGVEVWRQAQKARVAWYALAPDPACAPPSTTLAVPGGVSLR
jgi:hypothetical protein